MIIMYMFKKRVEFLFLLELLSLNLFLSELVGWFDFYGVMIYWLDFKIRLFLLKIWCYEVVIYCIYNIMFKMKKIGIDK